MINSHAKNLQLAARKVGASCHVGYSGVFYSVPCCYYGYMVFIRADANSVDILDSDGVCIASHKRCFAKRAYVTIPGHMPPHYLSLDDPLCYDGARLRQWAHDIGDNTSFAIDFLLSKQRFEEHAYKSCMAILQLSKVYGVFRLEQACRAARVSVVSYKVIKKLISQ